MLSACCNQSLPACPEPGPNDVVWLVTEMRLALRVIPTGGRDLRHLVREVGDHAHLFQLAVEIDLDGVALRLAARRGVQFGSHHLHVGVVARQQAAQKVEIAFVELLLRADVGVEAVKLRSQAEIRRHLLRNRCQCRRIPVLGAPLHARGLQRVFGKHNEVGRAAVWEAPFKCR